MTRIVEAEGLTKRFGKIEALAGLDLTVEEGQVVAVLGPNGAGKTTFVRTVATLLRPDEGTIRVAGYDVLARADQVRRLLGLAGHHPAAAGSPARASTGPGRPGGRAARASRWSPACTARAGSPPTATPRGCSGSSG